MAVKKQTFSIVGMHCSSCAMTIDGDLEDYLTGVHSSKTSYAKQETEVEYEEESVTEAEIISQIKKTGYQVRAIEK